MPKSYTFFSKRPEDFCWLDGLLLKNVYDLGKNFQIFFKNMLLTPFYLERHVMERKNNFWELMFILLPTRVSWRCLLIGRSFVENVYDLAKNFQIFFKNMLLTLFYLERHVMESKIIFEKLIFILMPTIEKSNQQKIFSIVGINMKINSQK